MLTNIQFKRNIFALLTKKVTQFSFLSILFDGCLKALCKLGFSISICFIWSVLDGILEWIITDGGFGRNHSITLVKKM